MFENSTKHYGAVTEMGGVKCYLPAALVSGIHTETEYCPRPWGNESLAQVMPPKFTVSMSPVTSYQYMEDTPSDIIRSTWYEVPAGVAIPKDYTFAIVEERGAEQVYVIFKPDSLIGAKHRMASWNGPRYTVQKVTYTPPPKPDPKLAMVYGVDFPVYVIVDGEALNYGILCSSLPDPALKIGDRVRILNLVDLSGYEDEPDGGYDEEWDTFDFRDEDTDD